MIVTVTPNPAIDQIYWVDRINEPQKAMLTRAEQTMSCAGGKGINVSLLVNALGVDTITMGFIAGFLGHAVEHFLHAKKITTNFVWTDGETRTNVIVIEKGREIHPLEVNAQGPQVSSTALTWFMKRYLGILRRSDHLLFGGSLPPGVPDDFYQQLIAQAHDVKAKTALYASGEPFNQACQLGPWISKPDLRERSQVLGKPVRTREEVYAVGKELLQTGSKIVVMAHTLTDPVAHQMVLTREEAWNFSAGSVKLRNRVGAGDAFMGGLLFRLLRGATVQQAGRYGMAASIASSESSAIMVSSRSAVEQAQKRVKEEGL